jgi:hypothetical protein
MQIRDLHTIEEVLGALGGLTRAAALVGKTANNANSWRVAGQLPAKTYLVYAAELKARGYRAPLHLWGMIEPESEREAS